MLISVSFRPEEVLGVPADASLEALRAAYHEKARRHHPDQQGDAWAFRVVNQAFEVLCRNRISARVAEEESRPAVPAASQRTPDASPSGAATRPDEPSPVAGIHDVVDHPSKLIDVELLLIRFAIDDPTEYLLTAPEQRNLSCSVNLNWPARSDLEPTIDPKAAVDRLKFLHKLVGKIARETKAQGHVQQRSDGRYMGWLTYPTAQAANRAFRLLHRSLRDAGMGVSQRTRELIVDRPGA
jgi:hypothetical protein